LLLVHKRKRELIHTFQCGDPICIMPSDNSKEDMYGESRTT
jgi:hypothetical protein